MVNNDELYFQWDSCIKQYEKKPTKILEKKIKRLENELFNILEKKENELFNELYNKLKNDTR